MRSCIGRSGHRSGIVAGLAGAPPTVRTGTLRAACGHVCRSSPAWWPASRPRRWSSGGSSLFAPVPGAAPTLRPSPRHPSRSDPSPERVGQRERRVALGDPEPSASAAGPSAARRPRARAPHLRRRRPPRLSAAPAAPAAALHVGRAGTGAGLPARPAATIELANLDVLPAVDWPTVTSAGAATPEHAVATPLPAVSSPAAIDAALAGWPLPHRCCSWSTSTARSPRVARPGRRPHRAARAAGARGASPASRPRGRAGSHVAVLTGRIVADVAARVRVGGIEYLGDHGLQPAGSPRGGRAERLVSRGRPGLRCAPRPAETLAAGVAAELGQPPWLFVERKGPSVAFHVRQADDVAAARAAVVEAIAASRTTPGPRRTGSRTTAAGRSSTCGRETPAASARRSSG